jgi:hypothetical protein
VYENTGTKNKKTAKIAKRRLSRMRLSGCLGDLGGSCERFRLDDAAVSAQRRHMARLVEEPNAFPFVEKGPQIF